MEGVTGPEPLGHSVMSGSRNGRNIRCLTAHHAWWLGFYDNQTIRQNNLSIFLKKFGKSSKIHKFDLFWTLKMSFRAIQSDLSFDGSSVPYFMLHAKIEQIIKQFSRRSPQSIFLPNFTFATFKNEL